ncbi:hypothetical protein LTR08_004512 [Meristemomyces frigidus]|nr:hypothetical protein LTR08_004512 [Meristemomyces frigidus]
MAKDEIRDKKEKKDKKRKSADVDGGLDDTATPVKKDKKAKKEKRKSGVQLDADGDVVIAGVTADEDVKAEEDKDDKEEKKEDKKDVKVEVPLAALVPFANPLCDDKAQKKVLKAVKKVHLSSLTSPPPAAAKSKALKRGVKECVKAIRKSTPASTNPTLASHSTTSPTSTLPPGIVILAADISPMDVISHLPVLCEDHAIPYLYVPSRAELGAAGSTKRPTSVVMLTPKIGKGVGEESQEEWSLVYGELNKLCGKLGQTVKV